MTKDLESADLLDIFSEFQPKSVKIVTGPEGKSKGFGFIEFPTSEDAKKALQELNECEVNGSRLKLEVSFQTDHLIGASKKADAPAESSNNQVENKDDLLLENSVLFEFLLHSGEAEDLLSFSQRYQNGEGVPQDYNKARILYEKLVEMDNDEGLNGLAVLYHQGLGVEPNLSKSVQLFRRAAEKGNSSALCNM